MVLYSGSQHVWVHFGVRQFYQGGGDGHYYISTVVLTCMSPQELLISFLLLINVSCVTVVRVYYASLIFQYETLHYFRGNWVLTESVIVHFSNSSVSVSFIVTDVIEYTV